MKWGLAFPGALKSIKKAYENRKFEENELFPRRT